MRLATAIVFAFLFCFGGTIALSQDGPPKPKVSKNAMTDEQLAVYRAVLNDYMKDSRGALNLSNKTLKIS